MSEKNYTPQEVDEMFALTLDSFRKVFLPTYKELGLHPKSLIHFTALLPFQIPIKDGDCITLQKNDKEGCTFWFQSLHSKHVVDVGMMGPERMEIPITRTRVEMIYVTDEVLKRVTESQLSDYFDLLLDSLNLIITGYTITTKDVDVHRISKEMIQFASAYRVIDVKNWYDFRHGLLMLHPNVPYEKEPLTKEKFEDVGWFANILNEQWNPFMLSEELSLNGLRCLRTGAYREAVIYAQMGVEALLKQLFLLLLITEESHMTAAEKVLEETSFMTMVKREFHPRLGGDWNPEDSNTDIGRWKKNMYDLRNRIVHQGYSPNYQETDQAVNYAEKLRVYVVYLVKKKKRKYPEIEKLFVTKDELSSR